MAITDAWLKAVNGKGTGKVATRSDRDGLSVRMSAKGKLTFQMRYRYDGKAKRLDLGSYPLLSLKQARAECLRLRALLEQGHDPALVKSTERRSLIERNTLLDLFNQWYESQCVHDVKKPEQIKRTFELHVLPIYGKSLATDISLQHWLKLLEDITEKYPQIASRVLTQTKKMYKWGVKRGRFEFNPLADITAKADLKIKRPIGKRVLTDDELKLVWEALSGTRISPHNKAIVKLCLFYGCRVSELRLAEKSHFDFDNMIWTVPPENHKMGYKTDRPLIRPIIDEIKPVIERCFALSESDRWVFTMANSGEQMRESTHIDSPYSIRQWLFKHKDITMDDWSMHDLRRTMRTNMSSLTTPHIAEIMIGHALPEMYQVYDKHDYIDEQKAAYAAWMARLVSIVNAF